MNKTLTIAVVDLVVNSGLGDYDQRSAMGMARSTLEPSGKMKLAAPGLSEVYRKRDELALALVATLDGAKPADGKSALAEARARVNAPFVDATMAGFRAARLKMGIVGSEKKNAKSAGKKES